MVDSAKLTAKLQQVLDRASTPLVCAYLFGSHARGQAATESDVDLGVLLQSGSQEGLLGPLSRLRGELERALGLEIDLVDMGKAPPDLVHRILRDGRLLLDRDPSHRIEFEVRARNTYFDILPYLREYRHGHAA